MRLRTVALALFVVLTACSGGSKKAVDVKPGSSAPTTSATTSTTVGAVDPSANAKSYFDQLGPDTRVSLTDALKFAAPGSAAAEYIKYLLEVGKPEPDDVTFKGAVVTFCDKTDETCFDYTDFTSDPATGLLTDFAGGGRPISDRLRSGDGAGISAGPATVTLLHAYSTISHYLFVTLDVQNAGDSLLQVFGFESAYVTASGRQVKSLESSTASEIQPGATATLYFVFDTDELGGTVKLTGTNSFAVSVPTPA